MKRYDSYKDSGVQWIGEIPSHWEVLKVKQLCRVDRGRVIPTWELKDGGKYPVYSSQTDNNGCMGYIDTFDYEGDVLTWTTDGIKAGTVFRRSGKFNCTNVCGILTPRNNISTNIGYLNAAIGIAAKHNRRVDILGYKIMSNEMAVIKFPLAPLAEQTAIANYLDNKCAKIDNVIATQEKRVELLRELKQSIITRAVTCGINPNAKLKDSGVEWIGEIPEHWTMPRLKLVTSKIGSGSTPKGGSEIYVQKGVKFLRSQNVYNDGLRLNDVAYITHQINKEMKNSQVFSEDVLYNITGASIGRCYYVNSSILPANVNQHVCIVRPQSIHYKYLTFVLQSLIGQTQLRSLLTGGNRDGLTAEAFRDFNVTYPPIDEQQQIVTYIEQQTNKLDSSITKALRQIELLKEYKQSLITEVVTGKRKVC